MNNKLSDACLIVYSFIYFFHVNIEIKKKGPLLHKTKAGKQMGVYLCTKRIIVAKGTVQKNIDIKFNPHIISPEREFIFEININTDLIVIIKLYKGQKEAEKLILKIKKEMNSGQFNIGQRTP